ncbi:MAG: EAL domain-containing protein [Halioglobus sp.]|nr:EAL domain-containing protein [Halioglobus sp.]
MSHFFLARQPIFDRDLQLHAYELLFRSSGESASAGELDGDIATARVIASAAELGIEKLTRGHAAFINLPQRFLEEPDLMPLSPDTVVLEILETVVVNDAALTGIQRLHERGFRIALDDFIDSQAFDAILPLVDTVKLDVRELPQAQWAQQVERLRGHGCKLLAEKVETRNEFEALSELGVDYFQGYFFARPRIVRGRQIAPDKANLIRTLMLLNDPDCSVDDIHELVSRDIAMSVKALNYVNSAASGLTRRIESIREAIVYLGRDTIKQWVAVYLIASEDSKPRELLTLALVRAKLCELLAVRQGRSDADACFTIGLFSLLDLLLDAPLEDILRQMKLTEDMRAALLGNKGDKGALLACAKCLQVGDEQAGPVASLNLDPALIGDVHAEAVMWADAALRDMGME